MALGIEHRQPVAPWKQSLAFASITLAVFWPTLSAKFVYDARLMLDSAIWGTDTFGYHLTSVLLHAVHVVLVWGIVRRLGNGQAGRLS